VSVKVLAGSVVTPWSAWRAATCTSHRLTPAWSIMVTYMSEHVWMHSRHSHAAAAATRLSRRLAAWRSIRLPLRLSEVEQVRRRVGRHDHRLELQM
jgi:hypothetical protein